VRTCVCSETVSVRCINEQFINCIFFGFSCDFPRLKPGNRVACTLSLSHFSLSLALYLSFSFYLASSFCRYISCIFHSLSRSLSLTLSLAHSLSFSLPRPPLSLFLSLSLSQCVCACVYTCLCLCSIPFDVCICVNIYDLQLNIILKSVIASADVYLQESLLVTSITETQPANFHICHHIVKN